MLPAVHTDTDPLPCPASGTFEQISPSRRGFLAGAALTAGALAVTVPAVAAAVKPAQNDERFWAAWHRWKKAEQEWEVDPDNGAENWAAQEAKVEPLFEAMLLMPVMTARAVLAKYQATDGQQIYLPEPAKCTLTMIGWDLERIAKQEMVS